MDHAVVAVASTDEAASPYERLGLRVSEPFRHEGFGCESRTILVGPTAQQAFYVELFGIFDPERARAAGRGPYLDAIARGGGLTRVMLKVNGLRALVSDLQLHGVTADIEEVSFSGRKSSDIAILGALPQTAIDAGLFESVSSTETMFERRAATGQLEHAFPLKRVDHLAATTDDLETATEFWSGALGVPVHGEVRAPGILIRQFRIGDSILELIARAGSNQSQAKPGLISMVAWEVPDLDNAVALARERGFSPSEPANGILPGTRTATIPAHELSGLAMQLLEYV